MIREARVQTGPLPTAANTPRAITHICILGQRQQGTRPTHWQKRRMALRLLEENAMRAACRALTQR